MECLLRLTERPAEFIRALESEARRNRRIAVRRTRSVEPGQVPKCDQAILPMHFLLAIVPSGLAECALCPGGSSTSISVPLAWFRRCGPDRSRGGCARPLAVPFDGRRLGERLRNQAWSPHDRLAREIRHRQALHP